MNQTQRELAYYKALKNAQTGQIRILEAANKKLIEIIKEMEGEEPRFLLDKDSICYGCPEYKRITDCDLTDPLNHWGEVDGNGGVCDTVEPCYAGSRNTYKKKEATEPLPCPFCGGDTTVEIINFRADEFHKLRHPGETLDEAVDAWNRRAE